MAVELAEQQNEKKSLALILQNFAAQQLFLGEFKLAESNLRHSIKLCREIADEFSEALGRQELGRLLAYRGTFNEADEELKAALALFEKTNPISQSSRPERTFWAIVSKFEPRPERRIPSRLTDTLPSVAWVSNGSRGRSERRVPGASSEFAKRDST